MKLVSRFHVDKIRGGYLEPITRSYQPLEQMIAREVHRMLTGDVQSEPMACVSARQVAVVLNTCVARVNRALAVDGRLVRIDGRWRLYEVVAKPRRAGAA